LDSKEKNFDILLDIGVGLGLEIKFKSMDLDFNKFPILEWCKPFLNRKFGIWSKGSKGKDLNFKRRFNPIDLNSIYFIELKGRFRMDIGPNFEWESIGQGIFSKYFWAFL
jgi:hypothetical protein